MQKAIPVTDAFLAAINALADAALKAGGLSVLGHVDTIIQACANTVDLPQLDDAKPE